MRKAVKKKFLTFFLTFIAYTAAHSHSIDIIRGNAHGSNGPMSSNPVTTSLDFDCPLQPHYAILTTQAGALNAGIPGLPRDDVCPASSTMVIEAEIESAKCPYDSGDRFESGHQDAGAYNSTTADHKSEKVIAAK